MPNDTTNKATTGTPVTDIKDLILEPGNTFTANGRNYKVSDTFAIGRLETITQLEEELMMFTDRKSCHEVMRSALELINAYKPGEAYMLLFNKIESDRKNAKLMHFALRVCTAYINYEGENIGYLTEEQIKGKLHDWSEEGLDVRPFIFFAMGAYKTLIENSKTDILSILNEAKTVREALNTEMDTNTSTKQKDSGKAQ